MNTREKFHQFIDSINDERQLEKYLTLFQALYGEQQGALGKGLLPEEREDLLKAYKESFDDTQLIANEEVRIYFHKWLEK